MLQQHHQEQHTRAGRDPLPLPQGLFVPSAKNSRTAHAHIDILGPQWILGTCSGPRLLFHSLADGSAEDHEDCQNTFHPLKPLRIRAQKSYRTYSRDLHSKGSWCSTEAALGWGDESEQPCEALSVHMALPIPLSFQCRSVNWKGQTKLLRNLELNCFILSTPLLFTEHWLWLLVMPHMLNFITASDDPSWAWKNRKIKWFCTPQMVSVLGYCRSLER